MIWFLLACNPGVSNTDSSDSQAQVEMDCPPDTELFQTQVWDAVMGAQCAGCHQADGLAGGSAMVLDPSDMEASMWAAAGVADRLVAKPSGTHQNGHGGGTLVVEGSSGQAALQFWADYAQGDCEAENQSCEDHSGDRRLRRLTHSEYDATVSDLLGMELSYAASFAADEVVDGFDNDAQALALSPLLTDQYRSAAEAIADQVDLDSLYLCDPTQTGYTACAILWIEDVGLRVFRRPLNQTELDRYVDLWAEVATEDGHDTGLRWALTALLQSPHFLYRPELGVPGDGERYTLTDWEVASELSYLVWGTMPDDTLFAAALAGELHTTDQVTEQVERMSTDPRTQDQAAELVQIWMGLDQLATVPREGLDDELRASMALQTQTHIQGLVDQGGTLEDLFTSQDTWVDATLAEHYGLTQDGWVSLAGVRDGGILAHASVLTTYALSSGSSPIHRGVLVREHLLCEELPPPPSNLDVSPPEVDPSLSTRERYAQHASDPACASCHNKIDPIGFGFEHYGGLGQWQDQDADQDIDASGDLDGRDFDGVSELSALLLEDARLSTCYVKATRRWASGAEACGEDQGLVALDGPLLAVADSPAFLVRTGPANQGSTHAIGTRLPLDDLQEDDRIIGMGGDAFEWTYSTDWGTGYCVDAVVTNTSSADWTWTFRQSQDGTISSLWNAEVTEDGSDWLFTGVWGTATLAPGEQASFGLCANR